MNNNFYDIYKNFMNSVSVLEEARTDDAKAFLDKSNTKYSPEDFQYLVDNEPTRNNSPAYKYILWMARSLKEGVLAKTIVNYINVYHNSLNKLPVQYRNIDAFKSFQDLKSLIDPMVQDVEDEQNKLSAEDVISFDSQKDNFYVTHEDKQSIVLRILTTQAACDLAQPVRGNWCLAGQGKGWSEDSIRMFYTYLGPHSASYTRMYFVYKKATPSDRSTNTVTLEIDGVKRTVVSDTTFAVLARQEKGNIEYSCFNRFDQTVSIETVANIFSNIKSIVDRDFKSYKASTVSRSDEIISKFNEIINANDSQTFEMFLSYYMSSLNNKEFIKFIEDVLVNVFASMPKNWQQLQMVQKIKKNFPSYFIEIKNIDDLLPQNIVNSIKRGFINDSVLRYHLNFTNTIVNMVNQNNTNIDYIKEKFANLMYEFRDGFNNAERYRILINNLNTIQTGTNQYENLKLFYLFFPLCNGQKMPFGIDFTFSDTHKKELRDVLVEELPKQENLKKIIYKKIAANSSPRELVSPNADSTYISIVNILEFKEDRNIKLFPNILTPQEIDSILPISLRRINDSTSSKFISDVLREVIIKSYSLSRSNISLEDFKMILDMSSKEKLLAINQGSRVVGYSFNVDMDNVTIDYKTLSNSILKKVNSKNLIFTELFVNNLDKLLKVSNTQIDALGYAIFTILSEYGSDLSKPEDGFYNPSSSLIEINNSCVDLKLTKFLTSSKEEDVNHIVNQILPTFFQSNVYSLLEMFNDLNFFDLNAPFTQALVKMYRGQVKYYQESLEEDNNNLNLDQFTKDSRMIGPAPVYLNTSLEKMVMASLDAMLINVYTYLEYTKKKTNNLESFKNESAVLTNYDQNTSPSDYRETCNKMFKNYEMVSISNSINKIKGAVYDIMFVDNFLNNVGSDQNLYDLIMKSRSEDIKILLKRNEERKAEVLEFLKQTNVIIVELLNNINLINENLKQLVQKETSPLIKNLYSVVIRRAEDYLNDSRAASVPTLDTINNTHTGYLGKTAILAHDKIENYNISKNKIGLFAPADKKTFKIINHMNVEVLNPLKSIQYMLSTFSDNIKPISQDLMNKLGTQQISERKNPKKNYLIKESNTKTNNIEESILNSMRLLKKIKKVG